LGEGTGGPNPVKGDQPKKGKKPKGSKGGVDSSTKGKG